MKKFFVRRVCLGQFIQNFCCEISCIYRFETVFDLWEFVYRFALIQVVMIRTFIQKKRSVIKKFHVSRAFRRPVPYVFRNDFYLAI